jgi:hypothetical protein
MTVEALRQLKLAAWVVLKKPHSSNISAYECKCFNMLAFQ